MKGVILAGGLGKPRLLPITKVTNKHLIPVPANCSLLPHPDIGGSRDR